jgi:hypothetical protein
MEAMAEETARELVSQWASRGYFRLKYMGDKIFVREIIPGAAYTIKLKTHYEQRSVARVAVPYQGDTIDQGPTPPDPWSIPVARPAPFEERTERLPVPYTEQVEVCSQCAGQGRVVCGVCNGNRQIPCPHCHGSRMISYPVTIMSRDQQGRAVPMTRLEQRMCHCGTGVVRCSRCSGLGMVTCGQCKGLGRLKWFDELTVQFSNRPQAALLEFTPVPDRWFHRLSGEMLCQEKAHRIESLPTQIAPVDSKTAELLAIAHRVDPRQCHILCEQMSIERIPVYEVKYMYAGGDQQLWICGKEREIYAPNSPWNRERFALLVTGCVIATATVVGLVVWWLRASGAL